MQSMLGQLRGKTSVISKRLKGFEAPTVWMEFSPLSVQHKSVNLGQGFPDWPTPDFAKKAFINAINDDHNQYCRSAGDSVLVDALAKHYEPLMKRSIDPMTEVTVTVGASEAIFAVMQGLINKGDEVVVLEPTFDIYPPAVQMAGGTCSFVPLKLNETGGWDLSMSALEAAITEKTKLLLLNTPHNPTGKVFTIEELKQVADILERHPHVTAVTDEVYEKLIFGEAVHTRLASLPGMWDRVITVSSSGKTFSCTGWKVGWCLGAEHLIKPIILSNQWIQYCVSTPTQRAIANILLEGEKPYQGFSSYYEFVSDQYEQKRDNLMKSLEDADMKPSIPEGGFFIMADTSKHVVPEHYMDQPGLDGQPVTRDWAFARWMTIEKGITPIPPSAFYTSETKHLAANLARFAYCKGDATLHEARNRLHRMIDKK